MFPNIHYMIHCTCTFWEASVLRPPYFPLKKTGIFKTHRQTSVVLGWSWRISLIVLHRGLRYQQKSWTFFGQLGAFPTFPQWFGWVSFVGIHFYMPPSLKITGLSLKVLVGRNRHKRKTICLPSIHFQGRTVGFTECNLFLKVISCKCKDSLGLPMTPPPHSLSWPYKGIDHHDPEQ